jgi:PAS domain S-box-containing protein
MEDIFKLFFEQNIAPSAIAVGPDYRFIFVNEAWERLFGFSMQEAIGHTSRELGIWKDDKARQRIIEQLERTKSLDQQAYVLFSKSGNELHVTNRMTRLEIDGKHYVLSSLHDDTEHWFAEKEKRERASGLIESLTPREREILKLVLSGHSNKEIATILRISLRTVEVHRSHAIQKLGTNSLLRIKEIADAANTYENTELK